MGAHRFLFRFEIKSMPPKKDPKAGAKSAPKKATSSGGGKAKKKKWSKGKTRQAEHLVLFNEATYDKLYKEVPTYKLITPSVVSERLKIRGSLARAALIELCNKGLIKQVVKHRSQLIYTRDISEAKEEEEAAATAAAEEEAAAKKGKKGKKS